MNINYLIFFLNTVETINLYKKNKNKIKLIYLKINNRLPRNSSYLSCVLFSLSVFALMIDHTLSRIWRSAIPCKAEICTLLAFTREAVTLPLAISSANTHYFALWRSLNSFFEGKYSKYTWSLSKSCKIIWWFSIKASVTL